MTEGLCLFERPFLQWKQFAKAFLPLHIVKFAVVLIHRTNIFIPNQTILKVFSSYIFIHFPLYYTCVCEDSSIHLYSSYFILPNILSICYTLILYGAFYWKLALLDLLNTFIHCYAATKLYSRFWRCRGIGSFCLHFHTEHTNRHASCWQKDWHRYLFSSFLAQQNWKLRKAYRIGICLLLSVVIICRRLSTLSNDISSETTGLIAPKFYL